MPLEIEAKLKVDSHAAVRAKLCAAGGKCLGQVLETNHIFDNADRALLAGDCALRIRTTQTEAHPIPGATLTYKGPRQDSAFKSRQEIQINVDDGAAAQPLLEALGFIEVVRFEKRRESWELGPCQVELDELPHLGTYVEIEGSEEACISRAQNDLGLGALTHVRENYITLLVDHCRQHNLPTLAITFD